MAEFGAKVTDAGGSLSSPGSYHSRGLFDHEHGLTASSFPSSIMRLQLKALPWSEVSSERLVGQALLPRSLLWFVVGFSSFTGC